MIITRKRCGQTVRSPIYRLIIDGKPSRLLVEKTPKPPAYRMPDEWDVYPEGNPQDILVVGTSLFAAVEKVRKVLESSQ